jgi:predicted DNA-binding transcriptional regulator AlpA
MLPSPIAPLPYMEVQEILDMFRISDRTLRNWVRAKRFPQPLPIGRRRLFWRRADVMRALGKRMKTRTEGIV